jgi:hypothetical protein
MSNPDLEAVLQLLGEVNSKLAESPKGAQVFVDLKAGTLTIDQAVSALVNIAREEDLVDELLEASQTMTDLVPDSMSPQGLQDSGRPVMMETSTGIPQLNPLLEASIAERASLDGDVPELRHGPLPEEGMPAVPVVTTSRDPVAIGLMLERASNEVEALLLDAREDHQTLCNRLLEDARATALAEGRDVTTALELTKEKLPLAPVGVEGYQAASVPALRSVPPPSPKVLAVMNPSVRRVAIYRTLATTQGRVSATSVIEQGVREALADSGIPLAPGKPDASNPWTWNTAWATLVYGPEDLSDNFNPIQNAIDAFSGALRNHATARTAGGGHPTHASGETIHPEAGWAILVAPYNDGIKNRRFGWVARIGPPKDAS